MQNIKNDIENIVLALFAPVSEQEASENHPNIPGILAGNKRSG